MCRVGKLIVYYQKKKFHLLYKSNSNKAHKFKKIIFILSVEFVRCKQKNKLSKSSYFKKINKQGPQDHISSALLKSDKIKNSPPKSMEICHENIRNGSFVTF